VGQLEELWRTWLEAHLWIERPGGVDAWWHIVPRRDGVVDEYPLGTPVHLLTAWNPRGEELSRAENDERQELLLTFLNDERVAAVRSIGASQDGSWVEPGFAILDVTEEVAVDIARRFEQAAIYAWSETRLEVVGALHEGRASVGWSLEEAAPPTLA
jgi:hypothetical protein